MNKDKVIGAVVAVGCVASKVFAADDSVTTAITGLQTSVVAIIGTLVTVVIAVYTAALALPAMRKGYSTVKRALGGA